jgi:hypothetical protein
LNKDAGAQYLKIGCYNTHPRGSKDISFLPQSDDEFMIKYPFKVEGYDNFYAMVLYTAPPT